MINKIYKSIHNKHSKLFKFFFFLRHVFAIFFVATVLFFFIPTFFNFEKKQDLVKEYLLNYYNLELNNFNFIKFKIFPTPNLLIKDASFKIKDKDLKIETKNLNIFLRVKDIYSFKDLKVKKIIFIDNETSLDVKKIKYLFNYFDDLKYKLNVKNLNINFKKDNEFLFKVNNINFFNYGYNKNKFNGKIFDKKFKAYLEENNKKINFKLLNTGIGANFVIDQKSTKNVTAGSSKIVVLNNFLKFDFNLNNSQLELTKSSFRNADLLVYFNSILKFNPYFGIRTSIDINKINTNIVEKINLEKILSKNNEIIKKINSTNKINYKSKKYHNNFIKSYSSDLNIAYGRLVFINKILISGGEINCNGDSILIDEYPRLNFVCFLNLTDTKKTFKRLSIPKKINNDPFNLIVKGSLNILNKKISFKEININKSYLANEEDLKYFKEAFEQILFDESFFDIFKMRKIKDFFLAVI